MARARAVELIDPTGTPTSGANPLPVKSAGSPSGSPVYAAGASGTVNVPSGSSTIAITAHSTAGGSVAIGGGASIPIPANGQFFDGATSYPGPLAIVFAGTDQYYVSWATP